MADRRARPGAPDPHTLPGAVHTGTLSVAKGGTGVTTSTGSGNTVLSVAPTFTGTMIAATIVSTTDSVGSLGTALLRWDSHHDVSSWYAAAGDANATIQITGSSQYILIGPGGAGALDIRFQRLGANHVNVDDNAGGAATLSVEGILAARGTSGTDVAALDLDNGATIGVGAAGEVRLRSNAGVLEGSENGAAFASIHVGAVDLTADVTGTLPVANGGTGVTSSTGTGSVVLSAAPTFTGKVTFAAGSAPAPAVTFFDSALGFYRRLANTLTVVTSGANRWEWDVSGDYVTVGDNIHSIGLAGASRPSSVHVGTSIVTPLVTNDSADLAFTTTTSGSVTIQPAASGLVIINEAGTATVDVRMESGSSTNMFLLDGGNNRIVMQADNGALPSIAGSVVLALANTGAAGDIAELSIISGNTGECHINLGDTNDEDRAGIRYFHTGNEKMEFKVGGNIRVIFDNVDGVVLNETGTATFDLRVETDTRTHHFFIDSGAQNTVLCGASAIPNFQSMVNGLFVGDVGTPPSTTATAGLFLWSAAGVLTTNAALTIDGNQLWTTDNSFTVGASLATRPSTIFVGTSIIVGPEEATVATNAVGEFHRAGALNVIVRNTTDGVEGFIGASTTSFQFGSSTNNDVRLFTNNTLRWSWTTAGHQINVTPNTLDVGSTGGEIRSLYVATSILFGLAQSTTLSESAADILALATGDSFYIISGALQIGDSSIGVSAAGDGRIRYNDTLKKFQQSVDGSAYGDLGSKVLALFADQLENPNTADWAVNALAPAVADTNNDGFTIRAFDDTTEEGIGFSAFVPADKTSVVLRFKGRADTGPPAARTVGLKLYNRGLPDNAAVEAWTAGTVLTDIDLPITTEFFQYDEQTITLATLGLTAGELHQFELTRINPAGGTELVGDWLLRELQVEFI